MIANQTLSFVLTRSKDVESAYEKIWEPGGFRDVFENARCCRGVFKPHFSHGKRREGPSAAGDSGSYSRSACQQADTSSGRHFDRNAPLPTTLTIAQQSSDRQRKSHRCEKCGLNRKYFGETGVTGVAPFFTEVCRRARNVELFGRSGHTTGSFYPNSSSPSNNVTKTSLHDPARALR